MRKLAVIFWVCLTTFPALCQAAPKWQVATITDVQTHRGVEKVGASDATSYDVSIKVGDKIYVVLFRPPVGEETVKYAAGRNLLVLVGKDSIRYNDILGQSYEALIESQKAVADPKGSKPVSRGAE